MPLSLSVPRELLGSAATVCQQRTPRRWAKEQERLRAQQPTAPRIRHPEVLKSLERTRAQLSAKAKARRAERVEQLRSLSHLSRSHAARALNISSGIVAHIAREFGLQFGQANAEQIAQLRELAGRGERINPMAEQVGLTPADVMRLLAEHAIQRGPRMNLEATL